MTENANILKPCPFCGGDAKYAEMKRLAKLQSDRTIFANACIKAVREIAASHNDPRALAVEILKTDPDAKDGGERE